MSLSASRLKTAIKNAILSAGIGATETNPVTHAPDPTFDKAIEELATAIIDEIADHIQVEIPIGAVVVSASGAVMNTSPIACNAS